MGIRARLEARADAIAFASPVSLPFFSLLELGFAACRLSARAEDEKHRNQGDHLTSLFCLPPLFFSFSPLLFASAPIHSGEVEQERAWVSFLSLFLPPFLALLCLPSCAGPTVLVDHNSDGRRRLLISLFLLRCFFFRVPPFFFQPFFFRYRSRFMSKQVVAVAARDVHFFFPSLSCSQAGGTKES